MKMTRYNKPEHMFTVLSEIISEKGIGAGIKCAIKADPMSIIFKSGQ